MPKAPMRSRCLIVTGIVVAGLTCLNLGAQERTTDWPRFRGPDGLGVSHAKGLPLTWMHPADELYAKLRGPAKKVDVIATAFSPQTSENEPLLMAIPFGDGRVFHTALGHNAEAMQGRGFQITLVRGAEWAATGKVTFEPTTPEELPSDKPALRSPEGVSAAVTRP